MRALLLVLVAGCGASKPSPAPVANAECPAVARHVMAIGPVDRWIAEGHEDSTLPIAGVSDRDALLKLFEVACNANWDVALRRCVSAQPTWDAVEDACSNDKVWWYQPT